MRDLHFIRHEQAFTAQRPCLPEQRDLPYDRIIKRIAFGSFVCAFVLHQKQFGDPRAVVDDALAPHFGRVSGQDRCDQGIVEERQHRFLVHAFTGQFFDSFGNAGAFFRFHALTIFGQVGEQREQHEAAHKSGCFVKRQRIKSRINRIAIGQPAMPVHAGRADIFCPAIQFFTAIRADHIAQ